MAEDLVMNLAPGAAVNAQPGYIRVWYLPAQSNTVQYWDFPISPGMLMRDLRILVARKSGQGLLCIGLAGADSQLWSLDMLVHFDQRVVLSVGPLDANHFLGPYLNYRALCHVIAYETMNSVIPLGALTMLSTPLEHLHWRLTDEVIKTGELVSASTIVKRVLRNEGWQALFRGAVVGFSLVAATGAWSLAVQRFLPNKTGYLIAQSPSLASHAFSRLIIQPARATSLTSALVWFPPLATFAAYLNGMRPAIPVVLCRAVIAGAIEDHVTGDDGIVKTRLRQAGYNVDGPFHDIPLVILNALLTHPFYNMERWVVSAMPGSNPWRLLHYVFSQGLLYSFWKEALVMDIWMHLSLYFVHKAEVAVSTWRLESIARTRQMKDTQVVRRMLVESSIRAGTILLGVGAMFYLSSGKNAHAGSARKD